MLAALLKSKLWLLVGGALLVLTAFYLAREVYEKHQIDSEVARLQGEIAATEGKNKEILELISYYKTTEYKERQARSLLGLAKPGEFVAVLPQKVKVAGESAATDQQSVSNLRLWWNYFFK